MKRNLQGRAINGSESTVHDAQLVELPGIDTEVGSLVVCQKGRVFEWNPARTYFLYDVPNDASRGGHAHKVLHQMIVAVAGSFEVELHDGRDRRTVLMRSPKTGLKLPPGLWRELSHFSGGAICLVLASLEFDEEDYIRDWPEFRKWKGNDGF